MNEIKINESSYHYLLNIPMSEVYLLVAKLEELKFIGNKEEYMRTHSNPLRVMISGVLVDFNGYKPEDFAKVACNTISTIMLKKGENKVRNEIKATLGII